MSTQANSSVPALTIGVIGAGTMGRGIVQLFAQAGHKLLCFDAMEGAASKAVAFVVGMIERGVEKGRLSQEAFERIRTNIATSDGLKGLAECDLVIEAIVEDLEVKRKLFASLEDVVNETAILVSNTSSLTVSEIASACRLPQRVAGLHFFNPVPLMKVAEVIAAVRTSPATVATLSALIERAGHRAVVTADQPGFLVNHAGRGLYTEGLALLEEQVASHSEVDTILRDAAGFRMGPFELLDLTGLDVSSKVMASIYEQFQQEPRFRPSSLVPPRVAAGLFGRKTGEGWYRYDDGKQVAPKRKPTPPMPSGLNVWIEPQCADRHGLAKLFAASGATLAAEPDGDTLLVVQPWGIDATTHCIERGLDASRCIAIDPLPGLARHRTLMLTATTTPAVRDAAHALLSNDGGAVTVINDSPGFVVQRVLATIVNIAANIAQRGIASVADIEAAVQLGLGYPQGPLAWGDAIDGARILTILRNMQSVTGDPRYRPSPWLVRRVGLGLSLLTPEAQR
jgi:3-hydroxybutyryl-CoA dehydrogenase